MAVVLNSDWGPFRNETEATTCLCAYVDKVCGPGVGISWATNGYVYPLRGPTRDAGGFGDIFVFQWSHIPAPPPKHQPPPDFWHRVKAFIESCMEAQGKAAIAQSEADLAMSQAVGRVFNRMFTSHGDDALGVALDVLCVAASIALIPTGLGVLGVAGLVGGAFLLVADGTAYGMELAGNDEGAEAFKQHTEKYRIIATVMTLPDIVVGGPKAIKELAEARELLQADLTTARSAETLAARTANASRAERYAQIAERAHLRSQLRAKQIHAGMTLEVAPRAAGVGSGFLMIREEILGDESALHEIARRLQVHSVAVHK
ncbi:MULTISPECIES: hypothetical protein [Nitrospirillum]|uniref:Uncharacterized protein n=2 Tax=Nitrospirillum TaxID=1543705 RepID=A0A248K3Y5_9PROT|nr:hypothetical protein [Nitrospirillum amazonense]ASG25158.1 hypothetical protein Y958_29795 [Nitrospirillum amazonense CBAmc]TWB21733.1 hypothetical protein FBZ88_11787 [Nitrospirillum amazonense]TWB28268.1 hypothetical protein FBZ91_12919 [Nitrospirillum amazonense]